MLVALSACNASAADNIVVKQATAEGAAFAFVSVNGNIIAIPLSIRLSPTSETPFILQKQLSQFGTRFVLSGNLTFSLDTDSAKLLSAAKKLELSPEDISAAADLQYKTYIGQWDGDTEKHLKIQVDGGIISAGSSMVVSFSKTFDDGEQLTGFLRNTNALLLLMELRTGFQVRLIQANKDIDEIVAKYFREHTVPPIMPITSVFVSIKEEYPEQVEKNPLYALNAISDVVSRLELKVNEDGNVVYEVPDDITMMGSPETSSRIMDGAVTSLNLDICGNPDRLLLIDLGKTGCDSVKDLLGGAVIMWKFYAVIAFLLSAMTTGAQVVSPSPGPADELVYFDAPVGFPTFRDVTVYHAWGDPKVFFLLPNGIQSDGGFTLHYKRANGRINGSLTLTMKPIMEGEDVKEITSYLQNTVSGAKFTHSEPVASEWEILGAGFRRTVSPLYSSNPLLHSSSVSMDIPSDLTEILLKGGSSYATAIVVRYKFAVRGIELDSSASPRVTTRWFTRGVSFPGGCSVTPERYVDIATGRVGCISHITFNADIVREIQTLLNEVDQASLSVDGVAGSKTRLAIRRFQSRSSMPQDGQVSSILLHKLRDAAKG
ncbi:peptidoglycan-binding domain-containing protein [Sinorhizobium medicae]